MKIAFIRYLQTKNKKQIKIHNAQLNMAKKPQIAWPSGGTWQFPFFLLDLLKLPLILMNQEKVRMIVHNMELLISALKEELKEPVIPKYEEVISYYDKNDVDEFYDENEDV